MILMFFEFMVADMMKFVLEADEEVELFVYLSICRWLLCCKTVYVSFNTKRKFILFFFSSSILSFDCSHNFSQSFV